MAKVISLRQARKSQARAQKRDVASANAAQSGLSRAQKDAANARVSKFKRHVDQHKSEDGPQNGET